MDIFILVISLAMLLTLCHGPLTTYIDQGIYAIDSPLAYSRHELIHLNPQPADRSPIALDGSLIDSLRAFGIFKRKHKTRRGKRSGQHSRSIYRSRVSGCGVNFNNLLQIPLDGIFHATTNQDWVHLTTINTRSIRNKEADFVDYVLGNNLDICAITETWFSVDDSAKRAQCTPEGYLIKDCPRVRDTNVYGGGTGIIYRQNLSVKGRKNGELSSFEFSEWIIQSKKYKFMLCIIYRPPYSLKHPISVGTFIDEFGQYLDSIISAGEPIMLTGDFNIHVNKSCDTSASRFLELIECCGFVQHVQFATHTSGNTLDLVLTRSNNDIQLTVPHQGYYISDHCFVHWFAKAPRPDVTKKTIKFRPLKNINWDSFTSDNEQTANTFSSVSDISTYAKLYNDTLSTILNTHAPVQTKSFVMRPKVPGYNQAIKAKKADRRRAENAWRNNKSDQTLMAFKRARNSCNSEMNNARVAHYSKKITDCYGDQRQLFKIVTSISSPCVPMVLPDHESDRQLANDFGKFFIDKIEHIRNNIADIGMQGPDILHVPTSVCLNFDELTQEDIVKLVNKSSNKQCSQDPMPTHLLKQALGTVAPILTKMVNLSLGCGVFPSEWKMAVVKPLLKKSGLQAVFSNYRPVSNLSFVSKLTERAAVSNLLLHLNIHAPLPVMQSAYIPYHSMETALIKIQSDILLNMDKGKVTQLVLLDLSAAFDTIDHNILINMLNTRFGIQGTVLDWCESYLTNRTQTIQIGQDLSDVSVLKYGVPQGSCLGPVFFTLYASPLFDVLSKHNIHASAYADDHQLYHSFDPVSIQSQSAAVTSMESCISDVKDWMLSHKLKINDSKTEYVLIGTKHMLSKVHSSSLKVGDTNILASDRVRNLGVVFDKHLSMHHHISSICKAAYYHLHNIRSIRKFLTKAACETLVHALIFSKLDYCNALLYGLPIYELNRLQKVQNAAARVVCNKAKYDHISPSLMELHWLPVKYRIFYKLALLVFKSLINIAPYYINQMIIRQHNTRYSLRSNSGISLVVPRTRCKTLGDRAFAVAAPVVWNELPPDLKTTDLSLQTFKTKLKTHYFSLAYT
jgi:exonuclease III